MKRAHVQPPLYDAADCLQRVRLMWLYDYSYTSNEEVVIALSTVRIVGLGLNNGNRSQW